MGGKQTHECSWKPHAAISYPSLSLLVLHLLINQFIYNFILVQLLDVTNWRPIQELAFHPKSAGIGSRISRDPLQDEKGWMDGWMDATTGENCTSHQHMILLLVIIQNFSCLIGVRKGYQRRCNDCFKSKFRFYLEEICTLLSVTKQHSHGKVSI